MGLVGCQHPKSCPSASPDLSSAAREDQGTVRLLFEAKHEKENKSKGKDTSHENNLQKAVIPSWAD